MITTLTILTYLLTHEYAPHGHLRLSAKEKDGAIYLRWSGISPQAQGLAITVENIGAKPDRYYSVLYNLPTQARHLELNKQQFHVNQHDIGINSWGKQAYHQATGVVKVTLFALDKRFSANYQMTGDMLEKKMKGHVIGVATARIGAHSSS